MGKAITAVTRYHAPGKREQPAGRIMRVAGRAAGPAARLSPPDPAAAARSLAAMGGREPDKGRRLIAADNDASRLQGLATTDRLILGPPWLVGKRTGRALCIPS